MSSKVRKILFICAGIIIVTICAVLLITSVNRNGKNRSAVRTEPTITIKTPEKISSEHFSVDVAISSMGGEIYPAVSMCIGFNSENLEFQGMTNGNVMVTGDTDNGQFPEWSTDSGYSNETGKINVMYLDISGGKYAFSDKLLNDDDNILFTLDFSLKDNAKSGDVYEFDIQDAVFATTDSKKSLSSSADTLKIQNGKVTLEERQ